MPTTAMVAARWDDLHGWQDDDLTAAWPAWLAQCALLKARPDWRAPCEAATAVDAHSRWAIRAYFVSRFRPYRVRETDGTLHGLVTGYYEPIVDGSRTRSARFNVPLHAPPDDLLAIELGDVVSALNDAQAHGQRLRGRLATTPEGRRVVVPYWTRGELMQGDGAASLQGKAIAWLADPIEAFFLQVQGSGRVRLAEGGMLRLAYADTNGQPYRSIGRWLIDHGELARDDASMASIQAWAKAHPQRVPGLLAVNPSYVFFREAADDGAGPIGSLGVPLTPERSIAVDTRFVPLGAPVFLATTQPNAPQPLRRLVFAQDTGSAIKGAVRADLYFGTGRDAGDRAGRMKQRGEMWVLLPR